ncbi:response regulator [Paenibacillus xanthanilyticus]|uniref:RNA helicase n=1 Tax=Paenibacillus xanthanilyticus TaxID=1783531 RepID=A0ABV8K953_9BACL
MQTFSYFIDRGSGRYDPFLTYQIAPDECYARQLCTYLVAGERQYKLLANEMDGDTELLIVEELGPNAAYPDENHYRGQGIFIEFRQPSRSGMLLAALPCATHFDAIRYLLKDVVDIPGQGQMYTTSTEVDENRGCYVIYVRGLHEPDPEMRA